jgi:regulator of nucleoside diphosphate kinase
MNPSPTSTLPPIYISEEDYRRLGTFAAAMPKKEDSKQPRTLQDELARAIVLPKAQMPKGVVTVNSRVRFKDVASGEEETYVLTWPEHSDGGVERVSVLAPVGSALIGVRMGDAITWQTPGGTRELQILEVEPIAEESLWSAETNPLTRLLYGSR